MQEYALVQVHCLSDCIRQQHFRIQRLWPEELLAAVSEYLGLTIPVLSDPDWTLHKRYGMKRGTRRE